MEILNIYSTIEDIPKHHIFISDLSFSSMTDYLDAVGVDFAPGYELEGKTISVESINLSSRLCICSKKLVTYPLQVMIYCIEQYVTRSNFSCQVEGRCPALNFL